MRQTHWFVTEWLFFARLPTKRHYNILICPAFGFVSNHHSQKHSKAENALNALARAPPQQNDREGIASADGASEKNLKVLHGHDRKTTEFTPGFCLESNLHSQKHSKTENAPSALVRECSFSRASVTNDTEDIASAKGASEKYLRFFHVYDRKNT